MLRIVEYARRALDRAGDPDRPLWLTEVTWSSGKRPGHTAGAVRDHPARTRRRGSREALPLLIRERKRLGVERIFWENWLSNDTDHSNPFNFSGPAHARADGTVTEKPAFARVQADRTAAIRAVSSARRRLASARMAWSVTRTVRHPLA